MFEYRDLTSMITKKIFWEIILMLIILLRKVSRMEGLTFFVKVCI